MKKILIVGCSFSTDKYNENELVNPSWASYFPKEYYVKNVASNGAGNLVIRRTLQHELELSNYDYVIVQWSTIDRWDYPTYEKEVGYCRYYLNGTNTDDERKWFYQKYYTQFGSLIDTLENILFAQQTLDKFGIPYSMISLANLMELDLNIKLIEKIGEYKGEYSKFKIKNVLDNLENTNKTYPNNLNFLLNQIDYSKFLFSAEPKQYFGDGMIEWIGYNNLKLEENWAHHFNKEQNKLFYENFISKKINI